MPKRTRWHQRPLSEAVMCSYNSQRDARGHAADSMPAARGARTAKQLHSAPRGATRRLSTGVQILQGGEIAFGQKLQHCPREMLVASPCQDLDPGVLELRRVPNK